MKDKEKILKLYEALKDMEGVPFNHKFHKPITDLREECKITLTTNE